MCICCSPALRSGQRSRVGCGGAGGGMRGAERALTAPPRPQFTAAPRSGKAAGAGSPGPGETPPTPPQGTVLQFFTRLRRHASLDGASPYFRIKKWKLESTQRASSLDTRGGGQWGPHGAVQGGWTYVGGGLAVPVGFVPPALPCALQGPPSAGSSRGSGRPARAWTRRTGTPIRPTSSSTLPTRTTWPSTPRGAPSCPPPPAPHPLSAGIFQ